MNDGGCSKIKNIKKKQQQQVQVQTTIIVGQKPSQSDQQCSRRAARQVKTMLSLHTQKIIGIPK